MKPISFNSKSADRVYTDYMRRCQRVLNPLSRADREESLLEINSLIFEYLEDHTDKDEMENLLDVIDRLGVPEEFLRETVAFKKVGQAVKTLNPKIVIQALALNIRNGAVYILLSLLYIVMICFAVLPILKLYDPLHV